MTTATFHGKILVLFFNKKGTFLSVNFDIKLNYYNNYEMLIKVYSEMA